MLHEVADSAIRCQHDRFGLRVNEQLRQLQRRTRIQQFYLVSSQTPFTLHIFLICKINLQATASTLVKLETNMT